MASALVPFFFFFLVPLAAPSQIYPSVPAGIKMISTERKMQQIDVDQIRLQPSQPMPERQDDWFVLLERIGEDAVPLPAGIQLYTLIPIYNSVHGRCSNSSTLSLFVSVAPLEIKPDMRKLHEFEVKTTETITWKRTVIGTDSRRDETRLTEIRPISAPLEREGGDDWFVWFDAIREPVVAPPGTTSALVDHFLIYIPSFFMY